MAATYQIIDQMNRSVMVPTHPMRIVSLVPSQTELLYSLGLNDEVVGQTKFCIHPQAMFDLKPRVGGTKDFNIEKIRALNPDLIIGNKEENDQLGIEALSTEFPVWMSDIKNLEDAMNMIEALGKLTNRTLESTKMNEQIKQGFQKLELAMKTQVSQKPFLKVAYLIWRKPWMAAGNNTFIDDMLKRMNFINVFADQPSRYPAFENNHIEQANPDLILLSSEPYPFKQKHIEELQVLCPLANILLVDGELFSWYGSRLIHSADYFQGLLPSFNTQG